MFRSSLSPLHSDLHSDNSFADENEQFDFQDFKEKSEKILKDKIKSQNKQNREVSEITSPISPSSQSKNVLIGIDQNGRQKFKDVQLEIGNTKINGLERNLKNSQFKNTKIYEEVQRRSSPGKNILSPSFRMKLVNSNQNRQLDFNNKQSIDTNLNNDLKMNPSISVNKLKTINEYKNNIKIVKSSPNLKELSMSKSAPTLKNEKLKNIDLDEYKKDMFKSKTNQQNVKLENDKLPDFKIRITKSQNRDQSSFSRNDIVSPHGRSPSEMKVCNNEYNAKYESKDINVKSIDMSQFELENRNRQSPSMIVSLKDEMRKIEISKFLETEVGRLPFRPVIFKDKKIIKSNAELIMKKERNERMRLIKNDIYEQKLMNQLNLY